MATFALRPASQPAGLQADVLSLVAEFLSDDIFHLNALRMVCVTWAAAQGRWSKLGNQRQRHRVRLALGAPLEAVVRAFPTVYAVDLSNVACVADAVDALVVAAADGRQLTVAHWPPFTGRTDWRAAWQLLKQYFPACADSLLLHALLQDDMRCDPGVFVPSLTPPLIAELVLLHPTVTCLYERLSWLLSTEQKRHFATYAVVHDAHELTFSAPALDSFCTDVEPHFIVGALLTKGVVLHQVLRRRPLRLKCSQFPTEVHRLLPAGVECIHPAGLPLRAAYKPPPNPLGRHCDTFICTHGTVVKKLFGSGRRDWPRLQRQFHAYGPLLFGDLMATPPQPHSHSWSLGARNDLLRRMLLHDPCVDDELSALSQYLFDVSQQSLFLDELFGAPPVLATRGHCSHLHGEATADVLAAVLKEIDTRDAERRAYLSRLSLTAAPTPDDVWAAVCCAEQQRRDSYRCERWRHFAAHFLSTRVAGLAEWFRLRTYGGLTRRTQWVEEDEELSRAGLCSEEAMAFADFSKQLDAVEEMLLCQKWYREQLAQVGVKHEVTYEEWWDADDDDFAGDGTSDLEEDVSDLA